MTDVITELRAAVPQMVSGSVEVMENINELFGILEDLANVKTVDSSRALASAAMDKVISVKVRFCHLRETLESITVTSGAYKRKFGPHKPAKVEENPAQLTLDFNGGEA